MDQLSRMTPKLNIPDLLRKHLVKEGHGSKGRLARELGVNKSTMTRWVDGTLHPNGQHSITIVEYLRAKKLEEIEKKRREALKA